MDELKTKIEEILEKKPARLVLSAPRPGNPAKRVEVAPRGKGWQAERQAEGKAFHQNILREELAESLCGMLEREYTQLTAQAPGGEYRLRVTAKGTVLTSKTARGSQPPPKGQPPTAENTAPHNRVKNYLLPEGVPVPPLVDMGVFTPEGRVVKAMYDKYRQVNRFVELVDDELKKWEGKTLRVVDFGCGKSYLTFVLYHFLTEVRGLKVEMTGLDLKADVVAHCNAAARKYGYDGLTFAVGDIARHTGSGPVDMVVTLHACDTATDEVLAKAVAWRAGMIFSVPCCQHELNAQMQGGPCPSSPGTASCRSGPPP